MALVCWAFDWRAVGNNSSGLFGTLDSIDTVDINRFSIAYHVNVSGDEQVRGNS